MEGLGRLFDLGPGIVPVDLSGGAATGKRINMRVGSGVTFVVFKGLEAAGTDDPVLTFQEHTAESAGTSATLPVGHWYYKAAAALAGTETWKKVFNTSDGSDPDAPGFTGTINDTVTLLDGATHLAPLQAIVAVEISANHLDDGFGYLSVNVAKAGATAQIGGVLAIAHDLRVQRDPVNMRPALF